MSLIDLAVREQRPGGFALRKCWQPQSFSPKEQHRMSAMPPLTRFRQLYLFDWSRLVGLVSSEERWFVPLWHNSLTDSCMPREKGERKQNVRNQTNIKNRENYDSHQVWVVLMERYDLRELVFFSTLWFTLSCSVVVSLFVTYPTGQSYFFISLSIKPNASLQPRFSFLGAQV